MHELFALLIFNEVEQNLSGGNLTAHIIPVFSTPEQKKMRVRRIMRAVHVCAEMLKIKCVCGTTLAGTGQDGKN